MATASAAMPKAAASALSATPLLIPPPTGVACRHEQRSVPQRRRGHACHPRRDRRQDAEMGVQRRTEYPCLELASAMRDDGLEDDQQAISFDLFSSRRPLQSERMILRTRSRRFLRTSGLLGRCVFGGCLRLRLSPTCGNGFFGISRPFVRRHTFPTGFADRKSVV